ncbi:MAG: hypothetical protein H6Q76_2155, partial [Firmicutes bacterium]|nr:hypothetical protein [Bacillota bacterium]
KLQQKLRGDKKEAIVAVERSE